MYKSLKRKVWLELAFFSGAFLSVYGFILGYESCGGFFTCNDIVNKISITFYQELIMYVGVALAISSIGLMSVGEAGSGGHFPSRHAILDFSFIMGAFIFIAGFGAFYFLCGVQCSGYSYEFGLPLMVIGADAVGFSLYFLAKIFRPKGSHILRWEFLAIGSMAVFLVSEFVTPLNWQTIIPLVQFNNVTYSQLAFVFLSLVGMTVGIRGIRIEKSRTRQKTPMISSTLSQNIPKGKVN
jgi:hypothetical protein